MASARERFSPVLSLAILTGFLLMTVSLLAIVLDDGGQPYGTMNLRQQAVTMYGGEGIYRYDSLYKANAFRGFDWANLVVVLPAMLLGILLYRRGRLQGQIFLAGIFVYIGYIYLIGVMGNAYNAFFLLWTALYALGLIGFTVLVSRMDVRALPGKLSAAFPRRSLMWYLLGLGVVLLLQYLAQIIAGYLSATPPAPLAIYTTLELAALELGLMIPLHFAGAYLLWKHNGWGYILGPALAFAAAITFTALGIAQSLYYFGYQGGSFSEVIMLFGFAAIAGIFAFLTLRASREKEASSTLAG